MDLLTDTPTVKAPGEMPPLLQRLSERKPEALDYLGVSYGLTPQLLRFWKRAGYVPLYLRHTTNELTGEHSCVMVRGLKSSVDSEMGWLAEFASDFRTRFLTLLSFPKFRDFGCVTALSILEAVNTYSGVKDMDIKGGPKCMVPVLLFVLSVLTFFLYVALTPALLPSILTPFDLKRLESYGNNTLDFHVILDLLPLLSSLFFQRRLTSVASSGDPEGGSKSADVHLSAVQSAILLGVGLQRKTVEDIEV